MSSKSIECKERNNSPIEIDGSSLEHSFGEVLSVSDSGVAESTVCQLQPRLDRQERVEQAQQDA